MIELTEQQARELESPETMPPRVLNPRTKQTFVLLPVEEYQQLTNDDYDDSPWTDEEMELLAWEAGKDAGWDEMDEYDSLPGAP